MAPSVIFIGLYCCLLFSPLYCIVLLDEIDSFLGNRDSQHATPAHLDDVNEFLALFDGFLTSKYDRVVVIAATNRPTSLCKGVLSRFGLRICTQLPDYAGRRQFVTDHFARMTKSLQLSPENLEYALPVVCCF